jgi:hypothetical protein
MESERERREWMEKVKITVDKMNESVEDVKK